jgi:hypothetical protein
VLEQAQVPEQEVPGQPVPERARLLERVRVLERGEPCPPVPEQIPERARELPPQWASGRSARAQWSRVRSETPLTVRELPRQTTLVLVLGCDFLWVPAPPPREPRKERC